MKKLALALVSMTVLGAPVAKAQVELDMLHTTCSDYAAFPPEQQRDFREWLAGFFSQQQGTTTVSLKAYEINVSNVTSWCGSHPKDSIMSALERAFNDAKTVTPGPVEIDNSMVTCKEFEHADPGAKSRITNWVSGYYNASKNFTTLDMAYFARNKKKVNAYCRRHPSDKLLDVVEKVAH